MLSLQIAAPEPPTFLGLDDELTNDHVHFSGIVRSLSGTGLAV